jgi:putative hydrolase of the HAD superfamily
MTTPDIKAVIFDLFHTLTSLEVSQAPGRGVHEILGIQRDRWFDLWTSDPYGYALGEVDVSVPIRELGRRLNPTVTEEQLQEAVASRRARFRHAMTHIEAETLDGLKRLRVAGYRLGMISNCGRDEIEYWHASPLDSLLDAVVFSCQVKLKKPDPRIYLLAAQQLNSNPRECLYVGNGGTDELAGARRAGMTSVLLTRHIEVVNPGRIPEVARDADWQVRTVSDLADRLTGHRPVHARTTA